MQVNLNGASGGFKGLNRSDEVAGELSMTNKGNIDLHSFYVGRQVLQFRSFSSYYLMLT